MSLELAGVQRLEITLKSPNPLFESWLSRWLLETERRNAQSQYKIREALQALRSYPLPLVSGRECAILRGFGTKLCNLIDEELRLLKESQSAELAYANNYALEVQKVANSVRKTKRRQKQLEKPAKLTKKAQRAMAEEEVRQRQVTMSPGNFRILLLVDTQETNGKNKRSFDQTRSYLDSLAVPYEVRRLTVGDFLWIARDEQNNELVLPYIVERKRMDDLASSIRDGRFHEQKHRLRQCGIQNVVYLIENFGDNEHMALPMESLQQAIANTQMQSGFLIARTDNHWRSISYLQGMTQSLIRNFKDKLLIGVAKEDLQRCCIQQRTIGLMKFHELYDDSARNAQLTIREVFIQQLLQLHSLSLERALALVAVYATPRLLFDAYEACESEAEARSLLANIRCGQLQRPLGEKISQTIYDFYKTEF